LAGLVAWGHYGHVVVSTIDFMIVSFEWPRNADSSVDACAGS